MKKTILGIVHSSESLDAISSYYSEFFLEISRSFDKFYIINLSGLISFREKKKININQKKFPKNFVFKKFSNSKKLKEFLLDKNLIAINNLGKNPSFFWALHLLRINNVKLINILNVGEFGLSTTLSVFKKNTYIWSNFYDKGFYYIFRILTILNILPKIEITFHSNIDAINRLNNGLSKKFDSLIPFFNISYYKKIIKVNSRSFVVKKNKETKRDYILFVDCPIMSGDRLIRDKKILKKEVLIFYERLNYLLNKLSKLFKKKIIISPHPKYKNKYLNNKNYIMANKSTREMIPNCSYVVFTASGAIVDAVYQKKKIINFHSKLQGEYQLNMNNKYVKQLKLFSINLDKEVSLNKKKITKMTNLSLKSYNSFIKRRLLVDGDNNPNKKIIKVIKNNFFK